MPDYIRELVGLDETEVARRRGFLELTKEDEKLLAELGRVLDENSEKILEAFYAHLLSFPETKTFFPDEVTIGKVKGFHREYFKGLLKGSHGLDHFQASMKIGKVHDKIKLPQRYFVGAYNKYLQIVLPLVQKKLEKGAQEAVLSLLKVVFLDISLITDAYIDEREKKLRENETKFRSLFEQSNDAVVVNELDGRIIEVNGGAVDLTGLSREELLKIRVHDLMPKDEMETLTKAFKRISAEGSVRYEATILKRGGGTALVEVSSRIVELNDRKIIQMIIRDVTERKEYETMLSELLKLSAELNKPDVGVDRIMESITGTSNRIVRSRFSALFASDEKSGKLIMVKSYKAPPSYPKMISEGFTLSFGEGPAGLALQKQEPLLVDDLLNNPLFGKWKDLAKREKYNAIYSFPIRVLGKISFILNLYFEDPHPRISKGEFALLETFTHQAGIAIYRANLNDEQKRNLVESKKRIDELEKFHKLSVGRELRMVELKDQIKKLETEVERLRALK